MVARGLLSDDHAEVGPHLPRMSLMKKMKWFQEGDEKEGEEETTGKSNKAAFHWEGQGYKCLEGVN